MLIFRRQLSLARSFYGLNCCHYSSTTSSTTTKAAEPLRILFCGSDEFSVASLRALHALHKQEPQTIASIDVVHRPAKRIGRGLKVLRDVPIKQVARELELKSGGTLKIHKIDTFTGWKLPSPKVGPINLIVAVSFGLFVPPRILDAAKYGGLNVHPSLLPDLRGSAPIHHTLLKRRARTGITVQTLHPQHFDQGLILAQTPYPGLDIPDQHNCTPVHLRDYLAPIGAEMLVDVIKSRAFAPPLQETGWYPASESDPIDHAGKITKADSQIDWDTMTIDEILLRYRVFGDIWCVVPFEIVRNGKKVVVEKRVIIHELEVDVQGNDFRHDAKPGFFMERSSANSLVKADLFAIANDSKDWNAVIKIVSCTTDSGKKGAGRTEILNLLSQASSHSVDSTSETTN